MGDIVFFPPPAKPVRRKHRPERYEEKCLIHLLDRPLYIPEIGKAMPVYEMARTFLEGGEDPDFLVACWRGMSAHGLGVNYNCSDYTKAGEECYGLSEPCLLVQSSVKPKAVAALFAGTRWGTGKRWEEYLLKLPGCTPYHDFPSLRKRGFGIPLWLADHFMEPEDLVQE